MDLGVLECAGAKVTDLLPAKGNALRTIDCDFNKERDSEILRAIKTLERINNKPAKKFWQEVDGQK
jgi:hypothetical protein